MQSEHHATRRRHVFSKMRDNSIFLLPAASPAIRSKDVEYPFRQESSFDYLTNFPEAGAIAVLRRTSSGNQYIIISEKKNPEKERWNGVMVGQEQAMAAFGADQAYTRDDFMSMLETWLAECHYVYLPIFRCREFTQKIINFLATKTTDRRHAPLNVLALYDTDVILDALRLFKDPLEIDLLRKAAHISAQAHIIAMESCQPGIREYTLAAHMQHHWATLGCHAPAYNPIVGGGKNSCILHYSSNQDVLNDGELVLIDAAAEYQNYAADITRTFPVNGRFSAAQHALYEIVLAAQKAGIRAARPNQSWDAIHQAVIPIITAGLLDLGLLQGNLSELIETKAYSQFYWHGTGHFLGIDVHDVGAYKVDGKVWRMLEPGMVLTIEPGLYIPAYSNGVDETWWNIGIRIEDDILITSTGNEVLSALAPKEIKDIECLMRD